MQCQRFSSDSDSWRSTQTNPVWASRGASLRPTNRTFPSLDLSTKNALLRVPPTIHARQHGDALALQSTEPVSARLWACPSRARICQALSLMSSATRAGSTTPPMVGGVLKVVRWPWRTSCSDGGLLNEVHALREQCADAKRRAAAPPEATDNASHHRIFLADLRVPADPADQMVRNSWFPGPRDKASS